ncbi:MATE family efflux transporter [Streptococcus thermophilus]|uniref:MATE family efflux transporter n=1 Tax=Streptococcus thermophilus TaxID=1308 RepID=UPI003A7FF0E5
MTETKKILNIALPAMAENLLQMLMGIVDSYLVAQVGIVAISGVSVANNIITIYQAIFIALGASSASVIARSLGKGDVKATNRDIWDAIIITLALSIVLGLLSIFFGGAILNLLGTEQSVTQAGSLYLAIVGGGVIFLALMTTFGNILRAKGRPRISMVVSLLTNLLNALLSSLAIFVGHWGIIGVATATVFSRLVGTVILWTAMKLDVKQFEVTKPFNKELLGIVLPAAGERLMMRAGDVVIVAIIVTFGTAVVGGNAIGENLTQFNYMPGMGVATATVILVANSLGRGDTAQMKRIIRESYWISTFLMVLVSGGILLFGRGLSSFFTDNKVAIAASQVVILYSFLGNPVTSATLVFTAAWQGLGKAKIPFYATTIGMWLIRIFSGYFLGVSLRMGLAGVWIATVVDNIWRAIFLYVMYRHYLAKRQFR